MPVVPPARAWRAPRLVLVVAAVAAACSDGGIPVESSPAPSPTIGVTAAHATVAVRQGESGTTTLTLARGGGFDGVVSLHAELAGGAAGVTAAFDPATAPAGATKSTVTLATTATTPAGDYPVTVTAAGSGVRGTATLVLHVDAAPASASTISLGVAAPAAVTVARGTSAATHVTLTRGDGYGGPVALSADSLPAGVTATFAPATLRADTATSTLTLAASGSAAPGGPAHVVLRARGEGVSDATFTLPVTVTPAPAGSYALQVAPGALTVVRGADADAEATATLARTNFAGAVRLSASGVPPGVTLAMPSGPLRGGTASLAMRAAADAAPGDYQITLTGTADGLAPVTTSVPLRVLAGGAMLDITMGRRPRGSPVVVAAGSELDKWDRPTIGVRTTCSACDVRLEATGAPPGIAVRFAPSGTGAAANPAVLGRYNGWAEARVAVAAGVPDGDYPITLTAAAGDHPAVATTLVVRVVSAGYALSVGPSTTVVVAGGGAVSATLRALPASGLDYDTWITVAASGAPAGLQVTLDGTLLSPDPGRPNFLTIQAAADVPAGDYPVTVRGTLPARGEVSATFLVRVVSPSQDRGSVPAELVGGTWKAGTVSLLSFWDSHTGQFIGRNGYLAYYTFDQAGTYRLLVYNLKRGPSGCATEVWSEWQGAATVGDGTLEVRPTSGRYKVADACFGNFYSRVASSDELEANSTTSYWAWERDAATGRTYLRVGSDRGSRESWNWFERTDAP